MPSPKKMSAAEARRRAAAARAAASAEPEPLPEHLELVLRDFVPRNVTPAEWVVIQPLLHAIMRRSKIRGRATFPQHLFDVSLYLAYVLRHDHPMELTQILSHALIEEWTRVDLQALDGSTRGTRRSRLKALASQQNPGPLAPPRGQPYPKSAVRSPYPPHEVAAICRLAMTQPSARIKQQLCAMVGLGLGAGLDSTDLKQLRLSHIDDRGDAGVWVSVHGDRPRLVVVRRQYEQLVRQGFTDLRGDALVLGRDANRKNVTANIVSNAVALGNAPHIEQARLRSTWLTELMCAPVPLAVVMGASGLTSARTLTELLPHAVARSNAANTPAVF